MKKQETRDIRDITDRLISFRDARDWGRFHNSKDLALALSIEAAELNELFLWKRAEEVDADRLKEELADVLIFAFLLAAKHGLDVADIMRDKIVVNEMRYPVEKSRSSAAKYDEL